MPPSYTTLFVCEHCRDVPPEGSPEARFLLLVCPSRPLEMGTKVHLLLVFDPPELVPFFPVATRAPLTALRLDIWGAVVGVKSRDRRMVEFEVENWNKGAPIQRAHIVAPWLPGLTASRDLRGSPETDIAELPEISELPGQSANTCPSPEAGPHRAGRCGDALRPGQGGRKPVPEARSLGGSYASWDKSMEYAEEQGEMYESFPLAAAAHHAPHHRLVSSDYWV